jgi:hypothetical protein
MAKSKKDIIKVVVTPATDNAHRERFVKVNGKVIPFGIPFQVTENDLKALRRMKEPKKNTRGMSVYEVMDKLKISQEKANKIMKSGDTDITTESTIGFVPKYNVVVLQ